MGKTESLGAFVFEGPFTVARQGMRQVLAGTITLAAPIVFLPRFHATLRASDGTVFESTFEGQPRIGWLPRGKYRLEIALPGALSQYEFTAQIRIVHRDSMSDVEGGVLRGSFHAGEQAAGAQEPMRWTLESVAPTQPIASLSWNKGHSDWFWRHFDHAATTTMSYLLGDHPDAAVATRLSGENAATAATPPTFIFHTNADTTVPAENSLFYFLALRKAGVPAELHVFERGPHGVGLANDDAALSEWS